MTASPPDLIIISGLSGSGKSVALQSLEDIGYYCIDNLPSVLLPEFGRYLKNDAGREMDDMLSGAALSIDSRNKHFLLLLDDKLKELEQRETFYRLLFLEAEEQMLIRRYSETRRKHPPHRPAHTPDRGHPAGTIAAATAPRPRRKNH